MLSAAAWSPSGSNLQPWNTYVLTGALLAELKTRAVERVAHGDPWDEREYEMYPRALKSPSGERRSAFGKERYSALGIARENLEASQRAAIANWNCFGAPAALFCSIDRDPGRPQWADVGMYLQTVMLLLRAEGLHSCPQMAWSQVRETVAEVLSRPDGLILFCGMSLHSYGPRPARRDGHVRRGLTAIACARVLGRTKPGELSSAQSISTIPPISAGGAAKRHRRDRRPGTSAVQRNRRPLSEGGRRPARGDA